MAEGQSMAKKTTVTCSPSSTLQRRLAGCGRRATHAAEAIPQRQPKKVYDAVKALRRSTAMNSAACRPSSCNRSLSCLKFNALCRWPDPQGQQRPNRPGATAPGATATGPRSRRSFTEQQENQLKAGADFKRSRLSNKARCCSLRSSQGRPAKRNQTGAVTLRLNRYRDSDKPQQLATIAQLTAPSGGAGGDDKPDQGGASLEPAAHLQPQPDHQQRGSGAMAQCLEASRRSGAQSRPPHQSLSRQPFISYPHA